MSTGTLADVRAGAHAATDLARARILAWATPLALVLFTVVVRLPLLDRPGHVDEFYHVVTAQSLLEDGDLATLDGRPYSRAWLFSYLVAGAFALFGESLVVGRLVSLAFGALLVLAVFLLVRRITGTVAATAAAIPLALDPVSVQLAQFVRFYTLHALLFWVGAWSVYRLALPERGTRARVVDATIAALALLTALHLQVTTVIGLVGIGAWVATALVHRGLTTLPQVPASLRRSPALATAAIVLAAAAFGLALSLVVPQLRAYWHSFTYVPRWAAETTGDTRFYLRLLVDDWPLLWLAFPVLCIGALRRAPREGSFALAVFAAVLVLHSLAAWKTDRYVFYGMPFFFAVCGMGIAWVARPVLDAAAGLATTLVGARHQRWAPALALTALIASAAFALVQMPGVRRAQRWLVEWQPMMPDGSRGVGRPDWAAALDSLVPYVRQDAVVLTSSDVKAAFYLNQVDGFLHMPEPLNPSPGDTISPYTGRPRIFTPERLRAELARHPRGLIVVEASHWRQDFAVPVALADAIEQTTRRVPVPDDWRLHVFAWDGAASDTTAAAAPDGDAP